MIYNLKAGEKLIVEISSDELLGRNTNTAGRRGMIPPAKRHRTLSRRRVGKTGIRFFDLGQIPQPGGGFSDFVLNKIFEPTIVDHFLEFYQLTESDWQEITDAMLSIENLADHSRLIEKPHTHLLRYGFYSFATDEVIDIHTSDRFGASNELVLTADELADDQLFLIDLGNLNFRANGELLSIPMRTGAENSYVKFTTVPDYDSEAVAFSVQNGDQFYIVPQFRRLYFHAVENVTIPGDPRIAVFWYLNEFYRIFPRQLFLDEAAPFYNYAQRFGFGGEIETRYQQAAEVRETLISDPNARAWTIDDYLINDGMDHINEIEPEDFMQITEENDADHSVAEGGFIHSLQPNGALSAIIVRGAQKIYVWQNYLFE